MVFPLENLNRLLGLIACNCQERTPYAPIRAYIDNLLNFSSFSQTQEILSQLNQANVYEISTLNSKGQGIFLLHSALNHSCSPNAMVINPSEDTNARVIVKAIQPISKGEEVCICYIDESLEYKLRQKLLFEHYLFVCSCPKCNLEK